MKTSSEYRDAILKKLKGLTYDEIIDNTVNIFTIRCIEIRYPLTPSISRVHYNDREVPMKKEDHRIVAEFVSQIYNKDKFKELFKGLFD